MATRTVVVKRQRGGGDAGGGEAGAGAGSIAMAAASEVAYASATRLLDVGIQPLDASTIQNPVMVIHAPRGSGCTTLLGALLAMLPGLHGAVVLTDRACTAEPAKYMDGILPPQVVLNRSPKEVLHAMIKMQQYNLEHFAEEALPNLCLVLDDILYDTKVMRDNEFKRDLKNAHSFNIAVLIATADAALLPPDVHTFATHVLATKYMAASEPKQLQSKMFVMYDNPKDLQATLDLCQPYEFLVGTLRVPPGGSRALAQVVHSVIAPPKLPVLSMPLPLVKSLSFALEPQGNRARPKPSS
jgi:energy-coupling factor transporter ATP-binding protein EcfA2